MHTRSKLVVALAATAMLLAGAGASSAANFEKPYETDDATYTQNPGGSSCEEVWLYGLDGYTMRAKGCFKKHGDVWYIQDSKTDASNTHINWQNWLRTPNGTWKPYRHGKCHNSLSAPRWGLCNKAYYESSTKNYYGGKGSRVRFQVCRSDWPASCTPGNISDAPWIQNNS